mmetsp:Transcript_2276/g.7559  ORF Transcript_2276/g.7559 Transcript_2276/m.7559 type:complete len:1035 (+) Transcript_2276:138-3242(+)
MAGDASKKMESAGYASSDMGSLSLGFLAIQEATREKFLLAAGVRLSEERLTTKPLPRFPEPPTRKAHWDHVLEEMSWLAKDFERERKWRYNAGRRYSTAAARRAICSAQERSEKSERSQQLSRKLAARVAREVVTFWNKINKVIQFKDKSSVEFKQQVELERQLDSLVCKTEHFASALSTMLTDKKNDLNSGGFRNLTDEAREAVGAEEEKKSRAQDLLKNACDSTLSELVESPGAVPSAMNEDAFLDLEVSLHGSINEYKPSGEEDWDDTETFDEQMRLEGSLERVDPSVELQELQDEAMIPIEELLKHYRLRENEGVAVSHGDRLSSDVAKNPPNQVRSNLRFTTPFLLKHELRDYQQVGLEWLASCHTTGVNVMLADEMGLGKTIQTISMLAHLACQHGIWGPHLIVVPTSVMVNWEVEFKKWCPALKILTYFGSQKERKLKRTGWSKPHSFHVCITTYRLAVQDQSIFRRKRWHYLILDEAHMIKNWKSQRWQTLLSFESTHRLLITGTPLQNDIMELWALLHFLMPTLFQSHSEFKSWFSSSLIGMSEGRLAVDKKLTSRLHAILRPFILRRLKQDVERTLPDKVEHIIKCRLSRRQKRLYDEYMSSQDTVKTLASSNAMGVMNCLMQLRKVCNHPDLFAGRSIISAFDMPQSLHFDNPSLIKSGVVSYRNSHLVFHTSTKRLCGKSEMPPSLLTQCKGSNIVTHQLELHRIRQDLQTKHIDAHDTNELPVHFPVLSLDLLRNSTRILLLDTQNMHFLVLKFMFRIPKVRARSPSGSCAQALELTESALKLNELLRSIRSLVVRTQLVFPDVRLVQFDCGKLQALAELLRTLRTGGHKVVIFTQMTRVLDVLEKFLNLYSYSYVRLDGTTKPEQRQILMQRFNADSKLFAFILSTRSGGFGINLTGADTVIFYDSDWNPAVDAQAQDRCHRIGQTRQVNIYRLISEDTIEENIFNKALQKRELDELAIQNGNFNLHALTTQEATKIACPVEVEDYKIPDEQADKEFIELCCRLRPVERYALDFTQRKIY